ncbi:MAG: Hint domain-containing protein [Paracoccaceae bacterium]
MSVRSKLEAAGRGSYGDTVDRLRAGASRMKAERARERHDAANAQKAEALHHPPKETPTLEAWPLPGLSPMTRVRTNFGDVHAAALRRGDEVLTRNGTYQAIQWLTRIRLDEELLKEKPDCNPVIIAAGALAPQIPAQDISVSPRQIIVADGSTTLMQSIEAAKLCTRPGIRRLRETSLSYTMFHVGEAAEVYVEGMYLTFPMDA